MIAVYCNNKYLRCLVNSDIIQLYYHKKSFDTNSTPYFAASARCSSTTQHWLLTLPCSFTSICAHTCNHTHTIVKHARAYTYTHWAPTTAHTHSYTHGWTNTTHTSVSAEIKSGSRDSDVPPTMYSLDWWSNCGIKRPGCSLPILYKKYLCCGYHVRTMAIDK